jgi:hypothetical protein
VLCNHEIDGYENCATKLLWTRVQGGVARALEQTTLAELAGFAERGVPQGRQAKGAPKVGKRARSGGARTTPLRV